MGLPGHTSGITLICPRACDEIHNAYRREDYGRSAELEEIRFMDGRAYNYFAVVAAARLGEFARFDRSDSGPFNAPPPPEIMSRIPKTIEILQAHH